MEIERKWLINDFPPIAPYQILHVNQGYISINPEVRIREAIVVEGENKGYTDYVITVKSSGDLVREEIEEEISKEFYDKLVSFIKFPMIEKDYRKYYYSNHLIEVSHVDPGSDDEFLYAEVEFNSTDDAMKYKYPFKTNIIEVTLDPNYKMKNYWNRTRIKKETVIK